MLKFMVLVILAIAINLVHSYDASPAITTQHQNILRSYGNLGQVATFSKTLDTPYSSVRKSDVRINNPGLTIATPTYANYDHSAFGVPVPHTGYSYPGYSALPSYATTTGIHTNNYPVLPAFQAYHPHGPAVVNIAAPGAYRPAATTLLTSSSPALTKAVVPGTGLLGIAYSPATAVSHMTFSDGLGLSYNW